MPLGLIILPATKRLSVGGRAEVDVVGEPHPAAVGLHQPDVVAVGGIKCKTLGPTAELVASVLQDVVDVVPLVVDFVLAGAEDRAVGNAELSQVVAGVAQIPAASRDRMVAGVVQLDELGDVVAGGAGEERSAPRELISAQYLLNPPESPPFYVVRSIGGRHA